MFPPKFAPSAGLSKNFHPTIAINNLPQLSAKNLDTPITPSAILFKKEPFLSIQSSILVNTPLVVIPKFSETFCKLVPTLSMFWIIFWAFLSNAKPFANEATTDEAFPTIASSILFKCKAWSFNMSVSDLPSNAIILLHSSSVISFMFFPFT